ncbi:MAG: transcription antitermination factor NusB [Flavobacteriales bacterium TMED123]|nr:MAG: transcription antitermination factor NusB [Flavobacteriales bacterium TMED123]|tara:strand:- start:7656 stop:8600 length:945 start_codon:yes stop_codon:yes gene_type:complete
MINRRHIRLKVMQSLYAYFTSKEKDLAKAHKQMLKQIDSITQLYFIVLSLLPALAHFSKVFLDEQKHKHFPTDSDINPNQKFANNELIALIQAEEKVSKQLEKVSGIWHNNDHDLIRKLFVEIWKSELYTQYIAQSETTFSQDQTFILSILNNFLFEDQLIHHILEEQSIYWLDDLPFVAQILFGKIKSANRKSSFAEIKDVFKNKDDKEFAKNLFTKTILNHHEFENVIIEKAKNWDLERIAIMDQILIKMALCELMYFDEIPVKVSLNEYIEVSKYYSTNKSKNFINGILDKVISEYKKSGKIKKVGRGLLE